MKLRRHLLLGLLGVAGCFEDPLSGITVGNDEESGDGDGDSGDGDGDSGDGDGDSGDGDGDSGDGDGDSGDGDGDTDGPCINNGETNCNGVCVNVQTDPANCGSCEHACSGSELCGEGICKPEKYVFATDMKYQGNFLAIQADGFCTAAASMAGLPGSVYRAWISSMTTSPADWLAGDGVYHLRQGEIVAYSIGDLFDGNLAAPINRTQNGEPLVVAPVCFGMVQIPVWTGTLPTGTWAPPDCSGWTMNMDSVTGRVGDASATDMNWSSAADCTLPCSQALPLYCVQQ